MVVASSHSQRLHSLVRWWRDVLVIIWFGLSANLLTFVMWSSNNEARKVDKKKLTNIDVVVANVCVDAYIYICLVTNAEMCYIV